MLLIIVVIVVIDVIDVIIVIIIDITIDIDSQGGCYGVVQNGLRYLNI